MIKIEIHYELRKGVVRLKKKLNTGLAMALIFSYYLPKSNGIPFILAELLYSKFQFEKREISKYIIHHTESVEEKSIYSYAWQNQ